jgi:hypothetical protein
VDKEKKLISMPTHRGVVDIMLNVEGPYKGGKLRVTWIYEVDKEDWIDEKEETTDEEMERIMRDAPTMADLFKQGTFGEMTEEEFEDSHDPK